MAKIYIVIFKKKKKKVKNPDAKAKKQFSGLFSSIYRV
jgi:hypothetical protein